MKKCDNCGYPDTSRMSDKERDKAIDAQQVAILAIARINDHVSLKKTREFVLEVCSLIQKYNSSE